MSRPLACSSDVRAGALTGSKNGLQAEGWYPRLQAVSAEIEAQGGDRADLWVKRPAARDTALWDGGDGGSCTRIRFRTARQRQPLRVLRRHPTRPSGWR